MRVDDEMGIAPWHGPLLWRVERVPARRRVVYAQLKAPVERAGRVIETVETTVPQVHRSPHQVGELPHAAPGMGGQTSLVTGLLGAYCSRPGEYDVKCLDLVRHPSPLETTSWLLDRLNLFEPVDGATDLNVQDDIATVFPVTVDLVHRPGKVAALDADALANLGTPWRAGCSHAMPPCESYGLAEVTSAITPPSPLAMI